MPIRSIAGQGGSYFGETEGLLVAVSLLPPDTKTYNFIYDNLEASIERWQTLSQLIIIPVFGGKMTVDSATQKERGARMAKYGTRLLGSATVILPTGLQGAFLRAIFTGIQLFQSGQNTTVSNIGDGIKWILALPNQRQTLKMNPFLTKEVTGFLELICAQATAKAPT